MGNGNNTQKSHSWGQISHCGKCSKRRRLRLLLLRSNSGKKPPRKISSCATPIWGIRRNLDISIKAPWYIMQEKKSVHCEREWTGRPVWGGWRNLGNFWLWNAESWALESGLQLKESGNPLTIGIRNPCSTERKLALFRTKDSVLLTLLRPSYTSTISLFLLFYFLFQHSFVNSRAIYHHHHHHHHISIVSLLLLPLIFIVFTPPYACSLSCCCHC